MLSSLIAVFTGSIKISPTVASWQVRIKTKSAGEIIFTVGVLERHRDWARELIGPLGTRIKLLAALQLDFLSLPAADQIWDEILTALLDADRQLVLDVLWHAFIVQAAVFRAVTSVRVNTNLQLHAAHVFFSRWQALQVYILEYVLTALGFHEIAACNFKVCCSLSN